MNMRMLFIPAIMVLAILVLGCANPEPLPDKSVGGTVLGAGWGAGAGAVIGNQVSTSGLGAGLGAGFGAAAGLLNGIAYDRMESALVHQQTRLDELAMRNRANFEKLQDLQASFDQRAASESGLGGVYQVFFDDDSTSLKAGSVANLQVIAEAIKQSTSLEVVHVVGHTDDTGNPDYNKRLAEARAREVSGYLGSRGVSMDQIRVASFGAERPIASNNTPQGRQLNRRVDVYIGH